MRSIRAVLFTAAASFAYTTCLSANDNREADLYKSWASHKPGTVVKVKNVTEESGSHPGKSTSVETFTLESVDADKVEVTYTTTSEWDGKKQTTEPLTAKYKAHPAPPRIQKDDDDDKPAAKPTVETKESEESVDVVGKSFKCKVVDETRTNAKKDFHSHKRTWTCPDVPNLLVKEESTSQDDLGGGKSLHFETKIELIELTEGR